MQAVYCAGGRNLRQLNSFLRADGGPNSELKALERSFSEPCHRARGSKYDNPRAHGRRLEEIRNVDIEHAHAARGYGTSYMVSVLWVPWIR